MLCIDEKIVESSIKVVEMIKNYPILHDLPQQSQ